MTQFSSRLINLQLRLHKNTLKKKERFDNEATTLVDVRILLALSLNTNQPGIIRQITTPKRRKINLLSLNTLDKFPRDKVNYK